MNSREFTLQTSPNLRSCKKMLDFPGSRDLQTLVLFAVLLTNETVPYAA
jgi:hypothetical protein